MKTQRKNARGKERASSIPIIFNPNLRLYNVQYGVRIKNRSLQPPTSVRELTINFQKKKFSSSRNELSRSVKVGKSIICVIKVVHLTTMQSFNWIEGDVNEMHNPEFT